MMQLRTAISEQGRDSSSPKAVILSSLTTMDLKASSEFLQDPSFFQPSRRISSVESDTSLYCTNKENPFGNTFADPLCKLNLKETSEFVKAFPTNKSSNETSAQRRREGVSSVGQRRLEAPPTPGRPVFSFSPANLSRKKSIPSKWDDAEKWLISSSSCHASPAHVAKPSADPSKVSKQKVDAFADKVKINGENVLGAPPSNFRGPVMPLGPTLAFHGVPSEVFLKDKFTDNVEPLFSNSQYLEPFKEGFVFGNSYCEPMKDGMTEGFGEVQHKDVGTEMTPLGSSTTSRCHTPIKISSPARHNTPANRSGPLVAASSNAIDIAELKDCHFAKLQLSSQYDSLFSNWSSREEEEEEISKSLRHFEAIGGRKSVAESRASAWEDDEKSKSCIRYQREEAKVQAWVNLQNAKAEAQSRKLEVKIQKMRSNLEEKLMKRMAIVNRKAEEWRAAALLQHSQQLVRAADHAHKMKTQHGSHFSDHHTSCGCFPCNSTI